MEKTKAQKLGITSFPYKEYDQNGNVTYCENSEGNWHMSKFDSDSEGVYYEDSDGNVEDYSDYDDDDMVAPSKDGQIVEIDGRNYRLVEIK